MKNPLRMLGLALALMTAPIPVWLRATEPAGETKSYVCPPCGGDCDRLVFGQPGVCPHCGMPLVDAASVHVTTVAILLFNGVQIVDYSGPWEVFGQAGYRVFTVAGTAAPVTTVFGQKVTPDYTFQTSPRADIVVLPGGETSPALCADPALQQWVRTASAAAQNVLTVCTGAFIAARAGLLDGLTVTTFHHAIGELAAAAPKARVVFDQRYVDNGKLIATAGLTSGIDGALHLVERREGRGEAQNLALHLEYDWKPDTTYARAALADRFLRFRPAGWHTKYLRREGDRNRWTDEIALGDRHDAAAVAAALRAAFGSAAHFVIQTENGQPVGAQWRFTDEAGQPWRGEARIEQRAADGQALILRVVREP